MNEIQYIRREELLRSLRTRVDITVPTLAQRNQIKTYQRRWGMLVAVYQDPNPAYNLIYELKKKNDILSDNDNWEALEGNQTLWKSLEW